MPDLSQSLMGHDLGHLKIVAELWGVEFSALDVKTGLHILTPILLERDSLKEMIADLPEDAHAALNDLMQNQGRLPWQLFIRRYGQVREVGPGRRDRERPYQNAPSPSEILWYRALIGRAFFDTSSGPEEFAYIPEDLLARLPAVEKPAQPVLGRPASPQECTHSVVATDAILDDACTLLAALRAGLLVEELKAPREKAARKSASGSKSAGQIFISASILKGMFLAAGLLDSQGLPQAEATRSFLEAPRGAALLQLFQGWLHSSDFNELHLLPGIKAEGEWRNDPLRTRQAVLDFLRSLPREEGSENTGSPEKSERIKAPDSSRPAGKSVSQKFWNLNSFIQGIKQNFPDFQRPAGDYDSWFLRQESTGDFLRGPEHWDDVEGALIRFMVTGPLHWLGVMDLASPGKGQPVSAFRFSKMGYALLKGEKPAAMAVENKAVQAGSGARLRVPRLAPRSVRYQLARFSDWEAEKDEVFHYRLTPESLARARQQGLQVKHLIGLLHKHAAPVSPALIKALQRWEAQGSEARLQRMLVLQLRSPEILNALRISSAGIFLGETIGPTAVVVRPGGWEKVVAALVELGFLTEWEEKNEASGLKIAPE